MKLKSLIPKKILIETFTNTDVEVGKIILYPIGGAFSEYGYKYLIVNKIENKERFGKPDKLIYSDIYYDDEAGYIEKSKYKEDYTVAWLSFLTWDKMQMMISENSIEKEYIGEELIPYSVVKKAFGD